MCREIFLSVFILYVYLCLVKCNATQKNNSSDNLYVSEEIGKYGKRYFIQYRRLGDTDTYVSVRRKGLSGALQSKSYSDEEDDSDETPASLRDKDSRENFIQKEAKMIDKEWNSQMEKPKLKVSEVAYELYKLMEANDKKSIHNASVIKCFFNIESEGNDTNIFDFDLSALDIEEDLEVVDAEINIYRLENENNTKSKKVDYMIRLYQIMPVNDTDDNSTLADLHKLLSVRYISSTYQGWQTFKLKTAIDSWMSGDENLGLMITAADPHNKEVELKYADRLTSFGEFTPNLVVYLRQKGEKVQHTQNAKDEVKEDKIHPKKSRPFPYILPRSLEIPCSRHIWYVNFEDLGWDNFIVAPKGYMAYRCKGSCKQPELVELSNHGRILKWYEKIEGPLEGPRCTPTSFKPLTIMFYDNYKNIVIKTYKDMIVEKCGCR